jgi:outer membrane biosynthesis protein TonB
MMRSSLVVGRRLTRHTTGVAFAQQHFTASRSYVFSFFRSAPKEPEQQQKQPPPQQQQQPTTPPTPQPTTESVAPVPAIQLIRRDTLSPASSLAQQRHYQQQQKKKQQQQQQQVVDGEAPHETSLATAASSSFATAENYCSQLKGDGLFPYRVLGYVPQPSQLLVT